ncbi:unnamed protein product [Cuscuta campestris]|uniref:CCHC-type domain-containing protein n=1 Tax=Cuscuta campestris TaxID=132261 RepID=A0A484LVD8_9ASTE|nr:unnamed protein product [Cuscuta campestris]
MLDKLEVTYEGTDQVREGKIDFLTQEYEMFRMMEGEKINDMLDRISKIINDLHALKKIYSKKDLVRKILQSMTPEWRSKVDAIYESIGISNVTIDGLRGKKHDGPPKCYGCGEIGHIKPRCPKAKNGKDKNDFKKQRAYISWGGDSGDESTDQEEHEAANLCLMAHEEANEDVQEEIWPKYRDCASGGELLGLAMFPHHIHVVSFQTLTINSLTIIRNIRKVS